MRGTEGYPQNLSRLDDIGLYEMGLEVEEMLRWNEEAINDGIPMFMLDNPQEDRAYLERIVQELKRRKVISHRANRKNAYYDPMSDSTTPMSQSELASEAEAVFGIVFDEDPNALLQRGAYGKIFDHFKRYGISNDYGDAVSMANYIEKNLLKHSHRGNRKGSINETLLKELMDEIVERERETGGWGSGDFNSDIEEVLWRRMTSPHSTKRLQDELGVPLDEGWRDDADGLTDLRFISVREFLHDQRWEDIFDVEYGSKHLASHRANRKTASERMNYGDVYTVHSDGSITTENVGDHEWVNIVVYEEEMNNDYMYDWDAIEAELYEGVVSSTGGAEPVKVGFHGHFIPSMSGVDVDDLSDLGPGEYRLCPVSLTVTNLDGDGFDDENGFDYDVVVRY